jgi:Bacteriophage probable baseplate hub protein
MISDTVELVLDDRDNKIAWPEKNAQLEILLGYTGNGLVRMGTYVVDELEHTGPPATLTIRGKAVNMSASLKSPQTRSWDDVNIGDLVTSIASAHGLSAKVSASLASIQLTHLDQTQESDLHLLTRIARDYGAITKPVSGFLVFLTQGEAKAASGQQLLTIPIDVSHIISHRMFQAQRYLFKCVRAYWHDVETATKYAVISGQGEPVFTLGQPYSNANEALHAAQAKLDAFKRGLGRLSLTVIGQPAIQASNKIALTGLREPIDGQWLIERVVHQLDSQGLITQIEAEMPNT